MAENSTTLQKPPRRNAVDLLRAVRARDILPGEISTHERRICVAYLRLEGCTQEEIAQIFEVHRQTIIRDEAAIRVRVARLADDIDVREVIGCHITWARHLTARALKEKDYGLAWRIQRELINDLQGLGYLPKTAQQHDIRVGTFVALAELASQDVPQVLPGDEQMEVVLSATVEDVE